MSLTLKSLPPEWSSLYPFQPNYKTLSCGLAMNYLDEGKGHPVVMVHGNPTWSFFYRNAILKLRDDFRCIVPDHIGCGLSDKPQKDYNFSLVQRISDLGELVDSLELDSFDLVVHDWGGAIGIGMALQRLERLRRIVILNTAAFADSRIPKRIAVCRWPILGKLIVQGMNGFAGQAVKMAVHKRRLSSRVKSGFLYPYRTWNDRRAVYEFVKDIPMAKSHPSFGRLSEIEKGLPLLRNKPATLIWGGKDFCFNDHFLGRWKRFLPRATEIRYPLAGHYLLEDETEKICDAIEEFVSFEDDGIPDTDLTA